MTTITEDVQEQQIPIVSDIKYILQNMENSPIQPIVKEGYLKKRNGRMQQWTHRYFVLTPTTISYKTKAESASYRYTFDLSPGCILTEVVSEPRVAGKKLYAFWIVWPGEKKGEKSDKKDESDEDDEGAPSASASGRKDLAQIVQAEAESHRRNKEIVHEQLELHTAHDNNVSIGAKVAAVAVGGVVVGALTAGIGLIPYLTVVGITAAASGSAVAFTFRRPMDSRLIIGAETMAEAMEWKHAIEMQLAALSARPVLPAGVIDIDTSQWTHIGLRESMRILEHDSEGHRCRRGQLVVHAAPTSAFLALMNTKHWPQRGKFTLIKETDDHADLIGAEVAFPSAPARWPSTSSATSISRRLCLSRFWALDDDGVYLITYTSSSCVEYPHAVSSDGTDFTLVPADSMPAIAAVLTITPRQDSEDFAYDVPESLVTCSVQINNSKGMWTDAEVTYFMDSFLADHLLEMAYSLTCSRYGITYKGGVLTDPPLTHPVAPVTPAPTPKKSRGVTTVQPGMEDMDGPPSPPSHGHRPNRLMRMFSRKPSPSSTANVITPVHPVHTSPAANNTAATLLRRQIAAAEYELGRKKKGPVPPLDSPSHRHRDPLQAKLVGLKAQYLELTGETYEASMRTAGPSLGALGRLRTLGRKRAVSTEDITLDDAGVLQEEKVEKAKPKKPLLPRPRHWLPDDYPAPPAPSALRQLSTMLLSSAFWKQLWGLMLHRRFVFALLVEQDGPFFASSNAIVLFAVLLAFLLMILFNGAMQMLFVSL